MNNYVEYETILRGQIYSSVFALFMIAFLSAMLFFLNAKVFSKDLGKFGRIFVNVFIVIVILSSAIFFIFRIYNINQDIESQAYITYCGEFNVSEYKESYVTFEHQNKTITLSGHCDLPGGEYFGIITYSQSSKHLLDWEINTN